jgi:hypothetical protein
MESHADPVWNVPSPHDIESDSLVIAQEHYGQCVITTENLLK